MALHVVVLAGGSGTRLWPLSRAAVPKHLLPLAGGGRSLLRATLDRVAPLTARVWVVTVATQARQCADELEAAGLDRRRVIAEPGARGTGPALGLAVLTVAEEDPEAVICSVHADHHISGDEGYRASLVASAGWAVATAGLSTIGVEPAHPATGLGYVEVGERMDPALWRPPVDAAATAPVAGATGAPGDAGPGDGQAPGGSGSTGGGRALTGVAAGIPAHRALGFVEKPDLDTATAYLEGGRHLWNTGLFAWQASTFLRELAAASAEIDAGLAGVLAARAAGDHAAADAAYLALPNEPVDTLVLERTSQLTAVRAAFGWSDLGSWADLAAARRAAGGADAEGNVVEGDAMLAASTRDCYIDARGGRRIAVVGVDGLVVVDTGDAVLILAADRSQGVKQVVDGLRREGRSDLL